MANLGLELRETIRNLEKIRDKQNTPKQEILDQIHALYEQLIDLINAAKAMQAAANAAKDAIDDLNKVEETIDKVANAIEKVATLLAAVAAA